MRPSLVVPSVFIALACTVGCEPTYPGTALGTYEVVESLTENTCGSGLAAPSAVHLEVELRADGALGYWRLPGQAVITGSYRDSDGAFEFRTARAVVAWDANPDTGVLGCTVEQREVIRGAAVSTSTADASVDGSTGDAAADAASADAGALDGDAGNPADAGASEAPELLVGEHTVEIIPAHGSDCGALLAASGGTFDALPCRARYTLRGVAAATTF